MVMTRYTFKIMTGITLQTRHDASQISTHIIVCPQLIQFVMGFAFSEFTCFPAFGDDYFRCSPRGSSYTDSNDLHQFGMGTS